MITSSKIPVYTWGMGEISSGGLMIFMSGAKGYRSLAPNTHIMSHQWMGSFEGKSHELASAQQDFDLTTQRVLNHYNKCTNLDTNQIRKCLLPPHDAFLTAAQAVSMGIADRIHCYE
jgi:ATP-dependent protease ClpP protease subunit